MKTLVSLLLLLFFATRIFAQGFAPTSLSNQIYTVAISSGSGVFAVSGVASKVFLANGQAVVLDASGDILIEQRSAYTYSKSGPNAGTIVQSFGNGALVMEALLTFTSPVTGTYEASVISGGTGTQTATFSLAPSTPPPLVNLSTRTNVAKGGQAIAGFVVNGGGNSRVLVRAIGPTLGAFGVGGAMANPRLQVFRSGSSTALVTVGAWATSPSGAATLRETFSAVGAFSLAADSRDSAVVLNLEPGAYTAVVTGAGAADEGEVLIEVYLYQ